MRRVLPEEAAAPPAEAAAVGAAEEEEEVLEEGASLILPASLRSSVATWGAFVVEPWVPLLA
jgi:hypothetical protein